MIADRVIAFYDELSAVAADVNVASDLFGRSVEMLDAALKKLNLGISTWVPVTSSHDVNHDFWVHKIGYAKIGGKWGVAIQTIEGNEGYLEKDKREEWL